MISLMSTVYYYPTTYIHYPSGKEFPTFLHFGLSPCPAVDTQ